MGLFGKLFHRHKEDDLFGDKSSGKDTLGLQSSSPFPESTPEPTTPDPFASTEPSHPMTSESASPFAQPTTPQLTQPGTMDRDLELINSKLDTLKAILTSIDQRIAQLEKAAGIEEKKLPW